MPRDDLREKPVIIVVKKKGHGGGHHGGAWKVAFADFMTAMMAMFLVLWIVGQSTDIKSAVAGHFQDPLGRGSEFGNAMIAGEGAQTLPIRMLPRPRIIELRKDQLMRVADRIWTRVDETDALAPFRDHMRVDMVDDGLRIQLLEDSVGVFFETGRADPSPQGVALLTALGAELARLPNPVIIEGHTDARPFVGTGRYTNWELSADRANAARRILVDGGLRSAQVKEVRGLADREPLEPSNPESPRNRRIAITMQLGLDAMVQMESPVPESGPGGGR